MNVVCGIFGELIRARNVLIHFINNLLIICSGGWLSSVKNDVIDKNCPV